MRLFIAFVAVFCLGASTAIFLIGIAYRNFPKNPYHSPRSGVWYGRSRPYDLEEEQS